MPSKRPGKNVVSLLLSDQELQALRRWARVERRSVAAQATITILNGMKAVGFAPEPEPNPNDKENNDEDNTVSEAETGPPGDERPRSPSLA